MSTIPNNQHYTNTFMEVISLKYKQFISMIAELNELAKYFIDNDGSTLQFNIIKGTDVTFLWKVTVRIECSKFSVEDTDIRGYRILRLNQFINIYNYIKQQAETMKYFNANSNTESNNNDNNNNSNNVLNDKSKLYDSISIPISSPLKEEDVEVCCICMERKPNLILNCTHAYCEMCIKEWKVTSSTCPICRCESGENDGFILADKPDYYHLQDQMSKSLFEITDTPKSKNHSFSTSNSDND